MSLNVSKTDDGYYKRFGPLYEHIPISFYYVLIDDREQGNLIKVMKKIIPVFFIFF